MQKKMLVLSAAIMGMTLSPLTLADGHDADEVMMASMPPMCMEAMDIMAAAGVDPDDLGDHPDVEAQVMATGATDEMCAPPEDHMMPPMGDDGMMPPMGDDGMMPPMGDDGMMPPMGDDGMMGPPPEGDMMGPPPMEP